MAEGQRRWTSVTNLASGNSRIGRGISYAGRWLASLLPFSNSEQTREVRNPTDDEEDDDGEVDAILTVQIEKINKKLVESKDLKLGRYESKKWQYLQSNKNAWNALVEKAKGFSAAIEKSENSLVLTIRSTKRFQTERDAIDFSKKAENCIRAELILLRLEKIDVDSSSQKVNLFKTLREHITHENMRIGIELDRTMNRIYLVGKSNRENFKALKTLAEDVVNNRDKQVISSFSLSPGEYLFAKTTTLLKDFRTKFLAVDVEFCDNKIVFLGPEMIRNDVRLEAEALLHSIRNKKVKNLSVEHKSFMAKDEVKAYIQDIISEQCGNSCVLHIQTLNSCGEQMDDPVVYVFGSDSKKLNEATKVVRNSIKTIECPLPKGFKDAEEFCLSSRWTSFRDMLTKQYGEKIHIPSTTIFCCSDIVDSLNCCIEAEFSKKETKRTLELEEQKYLFIKRFRERELTSIKCLRQVDIKYQETKGIDTRTQYFIEFIGRECDVVEAEKFFHEHVLADVSVVEEFLEEKSHEDVMKDGNFVKYLQEIAEKDGCIVNLKVLHNANQLSFHGHQIFVTDAFKQEVETRVRVKQAVIGQNRPVTPPLPEESKNQTEVLIHPLKRQSSELCPLMFQENVLTLLFKIASLGSKSFSIPLPPLFDGSLRESLSVMGKELRSFLLKQTSRMNIVFHDCGHEQRLNAIMEILAEYFEKTNVPPRRNVDLDRAGSIALQLTGVAEELTKIKTKLIHEVQEKALQENMAHSPSSQNGQEHNQNFRYSSGPNPPYKSRSRQSMIGSHESFTMVYCKPTEMYGETRSTELSQGMLQKYKSDNNLWRDQNMYRRNENQFEQLPVDYHTRGDSKLFHTYETKPSRTQSCSTINDVGNPRHTNGRAKQNRGKTQKKSETDGNPYVRAHRWKDRPTSHPVRSQRPPSGFPMCKMNEDSMQIGPLTKIIEQCKYSIGLIEIFISHGVKRGTGFRVGTKYVLTALHVMKEILDQLRQNNSDVIMDRDVHILFGYMFVKDKDQQIKLRFKPRAAYINATYDICLMELRPTRGVRFPEPVPLSHVVLDPRNITFFGHPLGQPQNVDPKCPVLDPNDPRVTKATQYWNTQYKGRFGDGYPDISNTDYYLLDCSFREGASGSPGIGIEHFDQQVVCAIFLSGFPVSFPRLSESEQKSFPNKYRFERALKISTFYELLKSQNLELCLNIFPEERAVTSMETNV